LDAFRAAIGMLAFLSLGFVAAEIYLTINKLWTRKQDPAVVGSISLMAKLVGLVPVTLFLVDGMLREQWRPAIENALWVVALLVQVVIALGFWLPGGRRRGIWQMLSATLRQESREVGDLIKAFTRPSHAREVLEIFSGIAWVDGDLDPHEREIIQNFADAWQIDLPWQELQRRAQTSGGMHLGRLRQSVENYILTSPPPKQAMQMADVIALIVAADGKVTEEEDTMLAELTGLLGTYAGGGATARAHFVALVPRSPEQEQAVETLLSGVRRQPMVGGVAFVAGPFYSKRYAELVSQQHRTLNYFSVVLDQQLHDDLAQQVLPA
jgi:tellurite resistance protein